MTENSGRKAEDKELRKLRAMYWSKRLDHTLTHTQTSSRLIYLIDGAVLALMYFSIRTLGATRPVILLASLPAFLLVALNGLHARLIGLLESTRNSGPYSKSTRSITLRASVSLTLHTGYTARCTP
jgi:hypothetical protein